VEIQRKREIEPIEETVLYFLARTVSYSETGQLFIKSVLYCSKYFGYTTIAVVSVLWTIC